jgi:hypothetical protein
MFSVEIKINSTLISHIYGHNEGEVSSGETKYVYRFYSPEEKPCLKEGYVLHFRNSGINKLIGKILDNVEEKNMKIKLDKSWTKLTKNGPRPKNNEILVAMDGGGYQAKVGYKDNRWWVSDFSTIIYWEPIAYKCDVEKTKT